MQNNTRKLYNEYRARQAQLNGVQPGDLAATFSVEPSEQQRWKRHHRKVMSF